MQDSSLKASFSLGGQLRRLDAAWLLIAAIFLGLMLIHPPQALSSARFVAQSLLQVGLFLLIAVALAAYAKASGADGLIARAFSGRERSTVAVAALVGALSPFCSCGVIPLIAAMLSMGVPLSAVMAFWLASPVMDPSMFLLTAGVIGTEFAIAKTLAAIAVGAAGGYATALLLRRGGFAQPLRPGVGDGGCGGSKIRRVSEVTWRIGADPERSAKFWQESRKTGLFLGKWLLLAFAIESLMLAYVPAEDIRALLGGNEIWAIPLAVLIGIPAYLNGYAALGLVGGLLDAGMSPGAGLAFLVGGGITSIPAAMAVFALVRLPVFLWYLVLAVVGALASGLLYQAWSLY